MVLTHALCRAELWLAEKGKGETRRQPDPGEASAHAGKVRQGQAIATNEMLFDMAVVVWAWGEHGMGTHQVTNALNQDLNQQVPLTTCCGCGAAGVRAHTVCVCLGRYVVCGVCECLSTYLCVC